MGHSGGGTGTGVSDLCRVRAETWPLGPPAQPWGWGSGGAGGGRQGNVGVLWGSRGAQAVPGAPVPDDAGKPALPRDVGTGLAGGLPGSAAGYVPLTRVTSRDALLVDVLKASLDKR